MDRYVILFLGFACLCSQVFGEPETNKYDNASLIRIVPHDLHQLEIVRYFSAPEDDIEILKRPRGINDSLDLVVADTHKDFIKGYARSNGLDLEVKHENYGQTFPVLESDLGRRFFQGFKVYGYNSYASMLENLESLASRKPELMTLVTVGNSYQGRRMKMAKISSNPGANNPVIFIDAGIHAREWVAPAVAMYLINRLTMDPESIKNELNGVDWYILPVVNPDGYEFTRTSRNNRLWRKTRSKTGFYNCYGVDGNRNYGFKWGISGVSNNPCDQETYAGPKPFSEPETRAVKKIMKDYASKIKLYVSLHAYGQYLVYPWGFTSKQLPNDWKKLDTLARKVSAAVVKSGGPPFKIMSAGQWYPAAGGSDDYAFGAVGIPYSYTMELTSGYEFQFPESNLRIVQPQFYEGFKAFSNHIRNEFGGQGRKLSP